MSPTLKPQLNNFSKDNYSAPEIANFFSRETSLTEKENSKISLEETASRAIADAINDLPVNQENITLASQKILSAAENLSPLEFENRATRLEEILQSIKTWAETMPQDMSAFYNLVYKGAQELRRNGDFYSLDALHDGAIEIINNEQKLSA